MTTPFLIINASRLGVGQLVSSVTATAFPMLIVMMTMGMTGFIISTSMVVAFLTVLRFIFLHILSLVLG